MKIFYTEDFKNCIKDSSKMIDLRYYGLRHGEFNSELVDDKIDLEFKSSPSNGFYTASGLLYGDSGIQLSIEVPETDSSFYYVESDTKEKESYYQAIIFYFTENKLDVLKPAFIIFGDYQYDPETKKGLFSGLNLTSLRNIITIKELPSRCCSFTFYQDDLVERLENKTLFLETNREGNDDSIYGSKIYIETKLDLVSREDSNKKTGYFRTPRINNFGLKLY